MAVENVSLSKTDAPLGAALTCSILGIPIKWSSETKLAVSSDFFLSKSHSISRHLTRLHPSFGLYPPDILERTEVDHWLNIASGPLECNQYLSSILGLLVKSLSTSTFLAGNKLTIADLEVFGALYKICDGGRCIFSSVDSTPLQRWFYTVEDQVKEYMDKFPSDLIYTVKKQGSEEAAGSTTDRTMSRLNKEEGGKFVELPGAKMGEVVVRFPPEASGYLHIGHAKAALLNQHYQKAFKGKLIMRFDDTNPEKEKADYEKVILEDLKLLEIVPDVFTHTSDHFDTILVMCEKLIKEGLAYADDTDPDTMKKERDERKESRNRNNSVDKNMQIWEEMKKGTACGQACCIRAKIDMNSVNGCLRDPTIYRCKNEPHVRTGNKYKVYPTYDFACPIVDSIEGVTHALRTTEYHDRDEQYFWFLKKLNLRKLHIYEYSRLNMNNTVLSKRKLTWFVNEGLVDGWDDARFPTVRGIMKRGMTVEGLKDFIISQGSSRSVVNMEWDKIWAFNKKVIDRDAPRYTALEGDLVPVHVRSAKEECKQAQKHPKDPSKGMKTIWLSSKVWIEAADASELMEGENSTFINWGNLMIKKVTREAGKVISVEAEPNLENTDYKKTMKLTWLADTPRRSLTPVVCVYFDHIINKSVLGKDEDFKDYIGHKTRYEVRMVGDSDLKDLKTGQIIQLQRKGFFRVDECYQVVSLSSCQEKPVVLFSIPDGHSKETPATSAKKLSIMSEKERAGSAKGKLAEKSPQDESVPPAVLACDSSKVVEIHLLIKEQGDKIRKLKSENADKGLVKAEIQVLNVLKANFRNETGVDWTPGIHESLVSEAPAASTSDENNIIKLNDKITAQGEKVRGLKSNNTDKATLKPEIDQLLSLKGRFKALSGVDWKADMDVNALLKNETSSESQGGENCVCTDRALRLHEEIKAQGDKITQLTGNKTDKQIVQEQVQILFSLKNSFKEVTGVDWKPDFDVSTISGTTDSKAVSTGGSQENYGGIVDLHNRIKAQGDKVRSLKSNKADKGDVKKEVDILLQLKNKFRLATGAEWNPDIALETLPVNSNSVAMAAVVSKPDIKMEKRGEKEMKLEEEGPRKQTRLCLEAKKEENFSEWYSQVITKSEMIEYYNVSGCYILRPWSYSVWESIRAFIDGEIKKLGIENSYFPIFVSKDALEKEKTHISDFSPEVAWVTKSGSTDMAEPVAIRPTSETVMYPAFAKWIQSPRDLPLRLNQWNNVVRWEFKQPTPFLRTREFLWQEGHTAFETKEEAEEEVYQILDIYAKVYEELLAIPVVKGRKTEKEKFAGGDFTTTTEVYIKGSGRGIQGATSHHLGQNFSKMFEIVVEDAKTQQKKFVYQNSWGLTTRTIGVMVMVHGDNKGLILPPKVAPVQVVVIPVGITAKTSEQEKYNLMSECDHLQSDILEGGIKCKLDKREHVTPGWRFNHWELKGVPLRLELGPREVASGQVLAVRRDTGEKLSISRSNVLTEVNQLLDLIQVSLYARAKTDLEQHKVEVSTWEKFTSNCDKGNIMLAPFCGIEECEDDIKKDSARKESAEPGAISMGAKSLCIPFEQPRAVEGLKCIHPKCSSPAKSYVLFGRSY